MLKEISRIHDIPNRTVRITAVDDLGATQEVHIAVSRDACPMCGTHYMKTPMGIVDVEATLQAVSDLHDEHVDPAIASFEAAGADMKAHKAARKKKK